MPVKIARSTPRPSFGLRELLVASHWLPGSLQNRYSPRECRFTLSHCLIQTRALWGQVWDSSGESRVIFCYCEAGLEMLEW
jgi:hypothetical protein